MSTRSHRRRLFLFAVSLIAAGLMAVVVMTSVMFMLGQEGRPQGRPSAPIHAHSQADDDPSLPPSPSDVLRSKVNTPEELRAVVGYCRAADQRAATELRSAALASEDPLVAGNAIRALGRLGLARGDTGIPDLLGDPRPRVRQEAVIALGKSGDPGAVEELARLIHDEDSTLRALAIQALGRLGGSRALALLEEIARDSRSTAADRAFARAALAAKDSKSVSKDGARSSRRTLDAGMRNN